MLLHLLHSAVLVRKEAKIEGYQTSPTLYPLFLSPRLPLNLRLNESFGEADNKEEEMERSDEFPRKTKDVSLQELRDRLAEFARVRGWEQYHSPRNLLLALVSTEFIFFSKKESIQLS